MSEKAKRQMAAAIRDELDGRGVELCWDEVDAAAEAAWDVLGLTWAHDTLPFRRDTHVPAPRRGPYWAAKRIVGPWVPDEDGE